MSKLLITGGTGTLGTEIANRLAAAGVQGRALVRSRERAAKLAELGFEVLVGDLEKPETLPPAIAGISTILLCSGDAPEHVLAQRNLIDAAARDGSPHIVKISAHTAGSTPPVSFGIAHREIEERLERSGLPCTIVRPYLFMQNFVRYALTTVSRGRVIAPVKDARTALVDLRDVASVVARILTEDGHTGNTYEISGPEALTFARATQIISHVIGRPVTHVSPPPFLTGVLLRTMTHLPKHEIPFVRDLFASIRAGAQSEVTEAISQLAGIIPRTFDDYVREHVEVFRG